MNNPVSTYRIQFHQGFTLRDLENIIPYLHSLGIGTLYASPIFAATPGSGHGYDVIDPLRINPEIGTLDQLRKVKSRLRDAGIQWLQDIVPNHMAYHKMNSWLFDVLEKGSRSPYARFFDTALSTHLFRGPVMAPFLGNTLQEEINSQNLVLAWDRQRIVFSYFENSFPLNIESYIRIFRESGHNRFREILTLAENVTTATEFNQFLHSLSENMQEAGFSDQLKSDLREFNASQSFLLDLAQSQEYELCHWRETNERINFRRFFTINGLICLNINDPEVFESYHQLIRSLMDEGVFDGLRIDHIDGLYDPEQYLENLRKLAGKDTYIAVEKILEPHEDLPENWPVQGSTGYEFLSLVNNLFTRNESREKFSRFYRKLTGTKNDVEKQIHEKKAFILRERMKGELENLYRLFLNLDLCRDTDVPPNDSLREVIGQFLIHCPVYRYYGNRFPLDKPEKKAVREILKEVRNSHPEWAEGARLLEEVFLENPETADPHYNERVSEFYLRCMQFTGPLMAKGVEDTLMYTYNRFDGHNEVGDSPSFFGISTETFHKSMKTRREKWPLALNATATHDTKRGEDVRMRLAVLTSLADEWIEKVEEWNEINSDLLSSGAPDENDAYLVYQTLIGAYPFPGYETGFETRLKAYLEKALREAKVHTNWASPNESYEKGVARFAEKILEPGSDFRKSFEPFFRKVARYGALNSLSQVLLKFTCPGIPDVYRGSELWNLSLVDPDNRRPVDFGLRANWLNQLNDGFGVDWKELWEDHSTGKIKLYLTALLCRERRNNPNVFLEGDYLPLEVKGKYKENILAFGRVLNGAGYIVVVPLQYASIANTAHPPSFSWDDTMIKIPDNLTRSGSARNQLSYSDIHLNQEMRVDQLFEETPVALIRF